jgi:hypothetical protein
MMELRTEGNAIERAVEHLNTYRALVAAALQRAGNTVREKAVDEQLSGRLPNDMGLNIITGTARDSMRTSTRVEADFIETNVYNTPRSFYLRYHQDGAGYNPKRLEIEDGPLVDYAEQLYRDEVVEVLGGLAQ